MCSLATNSWGALKTFSILRLRAADYQRLPRLLALNERYLSRASLLYDPALIQDYYLIADLNHFGHVMRDVEEWDAGSLLRRFYFYEQTRAGLRVNSRERLVKENNRRVARQRARQSDPRALTAREFAWVLPSGILDAQKRQQFTRPLAFGRFTLAAAVFSGSYSVGDILLSREVREEHIILEHKSDTPLLDRQVDAGS